jgi:ABC-type glycerol-3-phosphate transport system substrate-binding protein
MLKISSWVAALACSAALVGCGSDDHVETPALTSIVATAQATPTLSTLVAVAQFASNDNDYYQIRAR